MKGSKLVYVVDDDEDVRESLRMLLHSVGLQVGVYASADAFMADYRPAPEYAQCLLLDVRMPGTSGMALLETLHRDRASIPTVIITGHGDIPMAVKAMKLGAIDFLTKPYNHQQLLDLVQRALRSGSHPAEAVVDPSDAQSRWTSLTAREQEIFERIVSGQANKAIAYDLDISVRTVESHRSRIMQKMEARTLVDLVLLSVALKQSP
jgi:FixJ family two-component response regulator